jgi:hypothetical protein
VEEPEQPDPSALPLTTPPSASPVLSALPHPYHNDVAFDRAHLLHLLLHNRLLHSRVVITEEAASVYNKPTVDKRKGYKVGDKLHIVDLVNKVCPAEVHEVNAAGSKIFIHYSGWSKKWWAAQHTFELTSALISTRRTTACALSADTLSFSLPFHLSCVSVAGTSGVRLTASASSRSTAWATS